MSLALKQHIQALPGILVVFCAFASIVAQDLDIDLLNISLLLLLLALEIPPDAQKGPGLLEDLDLELAMLLGDEAIGELGPAVGDAQDVLDDQVAAAALGADLVDPDDAGLVQRVELREHEEQLGLGMQAVLSSDAAVRGRRGILDIREARAGARVAAPRHGEIRGHQLGLDAPALDEAVGRVEALGPRPLVRQQPAVQARVEQQHGDVAAVAPGYGAQPVTVDGRVVLDAQREIERQVAAGREAREGDALRVELDPSPPFLVHVPVDALAERAVALLLRVDDRKHHVFRVQVRRRVRRVRPQAVVDADHHAVQLAAHLRAERRLLLAAAQDETAPVEVNQHRVFLRLLRVRRVG